MERAGETQTRLRPRAEAAPVAVPSNPSPPDAQSTGYRAVAEQTREPDIGGPRDVVPVRPLVELRGGGCGEHTAEVVGD